jgi:hypothetical protein
MKAMMIHRNHLVLAITIAAASFANAATTVDMSGYNAEGAIAIAKPDDATLKAEWKDRDGKKYSATFSLTKGQPLLKSLDAAGAESGSPLTKVAGNVNPRYRVTLGSMIPKGSWPYIFFQRIDAQTPAPVSYLSQLDLDDVRVVSESANRVKLTFSKLKIGPYEGEMNCFIYEGSPFLQWEATMKPTDDWVAYIFDAVYFADYSTVSYRALDGAWQTKQTNALTASEPGESALVKAKHRTILGTVNGGSGTLAVFPGPHTGIYPLDESNNWGWLQAGKTFIGTKMSPNADNRYRPWIASPKGAEQKMDSFLLISAGTPDQAAQRVLMYTNGDYYKAIPGHYTMGVHFHPEFTDKKLQGRDVVPAFKQAMEDIGMQIVQPLEFHGPGHPFSNETDRLKELDAMYQLLEDYSDDDFLFIPGEEYNHFFDGHWSYMFPKRVYFTGWNSQTGREYKVSNLQSGGKTFETVYQIGNSENMLKLLREQDGVAWASHPRVKASRLTPDEYTGEEFYRDPRYQVGGWKNMPMDLSKDRLGYRGLLLMDDTAQWGYEKYQVGETDTFDLDPTHEIYAHLSINYVELPAFPPKNDWSTVVNAIKTGSFFISTGEVLIYSWTPSATGVKANVEWYFPPAFAEITWEDDAGKHVKKKELKDLEEFGAAEIAIDADLSNAKWVRFEFWDVARNGAFTQPHWFKPAANPAVLAGFTRDFTLIDADSDAPIHGYDPMPEGAVLDRSTLPANLTIRANVSPLVMDKVTVNLDGKTSTRTEWPFATSAVQISTGVGESPLFDLAPATLSNGAHTLTATPYRGNTAGKPLTLNFSVTGTPPPSIPANLGAVPSDKRADLTWGAVQGATSYIVKKSLTSGGPYTEIGRPTNPSFSETSLQNGVPVYYVVSALGTSESGNSAEISVIPGNATTTIEHFGQGVAANDDVVIGTAAGWHALAKDGGAVVDMTSTMPDGAESPNIADNNAGANGTQGYLVVGRGSVVNPVLVWLDTTENLKGHELSSVKFYSRNGDADSVMRIAVRIGGNWYVTTKTFTDPGTQMWTAQSFTNVGAQWAPLDISNLVRGNPIDGSLPTGDITAVGLLANIDGDKVRIDEFEIVANKLTAFEQWQIQNFGSTAAVDAAPNATPKHDGMTNEMRYALAIPLASSPTPFLPVTGKMTDGPNEFLSLTYRRLLQSAGINYTVEVSSDMADWKNGPANTTEVSSTPEGDFATVVTRDNTPMTSQNRRFIRLRVGLY